MIIFDNIDIAWWHYIIAGFCLGIYIHNYHIRHCLHWLIIGVLRIFIWMLRKSDRHYKAPKVERTKPPAGKVSPVRDYGTSGVEVDEGELAEYLKNPEISVAKR